MSKRIFIFSGYYGSGKTEVATNFSLNMRKSFEHVAIADMDVVNPYFRSRDKEELFNSNGVRLIAPPERINAADMPTLTAEIGGMIDNLDYKLILDMGGDDVGTIPLGSVKNRIVSRGDYEVFIVANINRPFTKNAAGIIEMADMISEMSGLKPASIISNTHLKQFTDMDMIMRGAEACAEAASKTDLDFRFATIPEFLYDDKKAAVLAGRYDVDVIRLGLFYHTPWEDDDRLIGSNKVGGVI